MPQNGAIMDSKAWGHYRLGEHEKALETIESAISMEPVDPEITEHLGDIYLALGRKNEAGWAYERSLGYLEVESDHKPVIEAKLKAIYEPNSINAKAKGKVPDISPAKKLKSNKK
jgi:tetratricopeptide (TPR) repeat protein